MMRKLPFVGLLSAIVATSSAHAQSVSPDASVISPSTGGALRTADGTWSFGAALSQYPGNWTILLNGASAAGGGGSELEVANGGQMYALGAGLNWQLWQNSGWVLAASPASAPVSPDGSVISPSTGGSLQTAVGTWSFGAPLAQYPGNFAILLNGASAASLPSPTAGSCTRSACRTGTSGKTEHGTHHLILSLIHI